MILNEVYIKLKFKKQGQHNTFDKSFIVLDEYFQGEEISQVKRNKMSFP